MQTFTFFSTDHYSHPYPHINNTFTTPTLGIMTQPVPVVIHSIDPSITAMKAPQGTIFYFLLVFQLLNNGVYNPYDI
jgi:hypothetical protein